MTFGAHLKGPDFTGYADGSEVGRCKRAMVRLKGILLRFEERPWSSGGSRTGVRGGGKREGQKCGLSAGLGDCADSKLAFEFRTGSYQVLGSIFLTELVKGDLWGNVEGSWVRNFFRVGVTNSDLGVSKPDVGKKRNAFS